jgi:hypothetical protein
MSTFFMTDSDLAGEPDFSNVCDVFGMSQRGDERVVDRCPDDERAVADAGQGGSRSGSWSAR